MAPVGIAREDPRAPEVRALLERHLELMRGITPPQDVHALEPGGLADPAVTLFGYREAGRLLAVGALRELDAGHGELKAMHTLEAARRRGLAMAIARHLIAAARDRGYERVSIETGAGPGFAPARALYARLGFRPCGPFGEYRDSANSAYMTLLLREG